MRQQQVFDTMSRELRPLGGEPGRTIGIYCCGPTVYDVPHAGHARAAVAFDVLVRSLRARGEQVTYVRNITDIDDKILARAAERGEPPLELARRMEAVYREQMAAVGCLTPDHEPRVSDHVPDIIALVERLVASGAAYVQPMPGGTTDVYFSVRQFPGYGKLSRRRLEDLQAGARVEADETKRDPFDFALWKGAADGDWAWDSPWGRGRPGWHIECSAMAARYLGHSFDVHCGGLDLVFPHHENEIAQSEAACPGCGPYARLWMHNGFVTVDAEKMSKSLGNFITVADVLRVNDPEALRWFLLTVSYRGPIQFDVQRVCGACGAANEGQLDACASCGAALAGARVRFPGVDEAERRVDYLYGALERVGQMADPAVTVPGKLPSELRDLRAAIDDAERAVEDALADDLNTAVAIAALGELGRIGNDLADRVVKRKKDKLFCGAANVVGMFLTVAVRRTADKLGLLQATPEEYAVRTRARRLAARGLTAAAVQRLVDERVQARSARDFARADELRKELAALGVELMDTTDGTTWTTAL